MGKVTMPTVKLVAYTGVVGNDKVIDDLVEQAASVCYDSTPTKSWRIAQGCARSGHMSVFEHISFTFHVSGVSRALLAQLSRHRHISLSVRSQRYCKEDGFDFVMPKEFEEPGPKNTSFKCAMDMSQVEYSSLLQAGAKPEDARMVLPNACCTELYVTMNARTLIETGYLRLCMRAQREIRILFNMMADAIRDVSPLVYGLMVPKCEKNAGYPFCTERECCGRHPRLKDVYDKSGGNTK